MFPELTDVEACWLNMSYIKQLNAGSWFLRVSECALQFWLYDIVSQSMNEM